jgi:ubiquinone/menaquinone biosynthesis C-methylase UbiE
MSTYAFKNDWDRARQRLAFLEQGLDPGTFRRVTALGIADGWQCLEVGAGGGSVAQWLCTQVGASGRVVAVDIDTRFLDGLKESNLEVRCHNLLTDDLPQNTFDLVHTRMVLMHIPSRDEILPRLVSALKPGGWLLIEEADIYPILATAQGSLRQVWDAFGRSMVQDSGVAPDWARQLPQLLARQGLQAVGAEGEITVFPGASKMAQFWNLTWTQVRERILAAGVDENILEEVLEMLRDSTEWFTGPAIIAAWGRRAG